MPSRIAAFALGLAGLGAGGFAVFVTHLEAGPVGLLAVGLIFMIVALAGTLPTRLKVGENEAAWEVERQAVEIFVERVAENAPAESQPEVLDALSDLAEDAPEVAARGLSAMRFEMLVRQEIESITRELEASSHGPHPIRFLAQVSDDKQRIDTTLEGPNGRRVMVEIRGSTKGSGSPIWLDIMHQGLFHESSASGGFDAMLFVTRVPLTSETQERVNKYPEVHHVVFRGPQDRKALKQSLRKVVAA